MATIDMKATGANIRAYIKNNKMKIAEVQAVFGFNTPQAIYKWMWGDSRQGDGSERGIFFRMPESTYD